MFMCEVIRVYIIGQWMTVHIQRIPKRSPRCPAGEARPSRSVQGRSEYRILSRKGRGKCAVQGFKLRYTRLQTHPYVEPKRTTSL